MGYPEARIEDVVDDYHGTPVPDPYRWLENTGSDEVEAWYDAQDKLTRPFLDDRPARGWFEERLPKLLPGYVGPPTARGDRLFFSRRLPDEDLPVHLVRYADGTEKVLLDPAKLSDDGTTVVDLTTPSPDGKRYAYQVSHGGDEQSILYVMDVDSGEIIDGPIDRLRYSTIAWMPDGDAFYYMRKLAADEAPDGDSELHRRVRFHRIGDDPANDPLIFGGDSAKGTYFGYSVSRDGRWLIMSSSVGTEPRNDLWIADLEGDGHFEPIHVGIDAQTSAFVEDGRLWVYTNLDAPRYRIAVTDPLEPGPDAWRTVIAETEHPIEGFTMLRDRLVIVRSVDVVSRITFHDLEDGSETGEVELPGLGSAGVVGRPEPGSDFWIDYNDFVTPSLVLHHDTETGETTTWASTPGDFESPAVSATQTFYRSADGTKVPMFVIAPAGAEPVAGSPRPTILYGYGGFNNALAPGYSPSIAAWVGAGGVYAIANLRGGSEYGEEWHRAGMRDQKQNVFDDFHAAAEHLIAEGWTDTDHIGISGGSNGGLLVGAALTQRPDLYRSVVCSAPLLDMIRYELFGLGQTWNDEYGRADDPVEFKWLWGYSPYHRIEDGTAYPATLFTVFEGDSRVDTLHARKMCARLQAATSGDPDTHPILIRSERGVGHGARSVSRTVGLSADTLAFHAWALGLEPS